MKRNYTRLFIMSTFLFFLITSFLIPLTNATSAQAAGELNWVDARGPGNGDAMAMVCDNVHGILYRATIGEGGSVQAGKGVWKYQAASRRTER
ncbi:MAG: hypothetical protein A2W01_02800 [Candidatus Solincola sediminis]|nr:MAG: hypothetical protein A2W01_02800 [Candidatus Solincola sediminis]